MRGRATIGLVLFMVLAGSALLVPGTAVAAPGDLDSLFGGGGKVTTDFGNFAEAAALVLQPDGKILAAGRAVVSGSTEFAVVRYNADGTLDTTFDAGGR